MDEERDVEEVVHGRESDEQVAASGRIPARIARALGGAALEATVALAVIVVGIVVGGVSGQLLTGLGGVLISYSTTLSLVEERARERETAREKELRGREVDKLRSFYRQIYNTFLQIIEATAEPGDGLTSFALITQSNRNLFFLLTEIEAIIGELDIRVASLTNRMRLNMQEMEVLRDSSTDDESAQRLVDLEEEQISLKHQLAVATSGRGSSPPPVSRRRRYVRALADLRPPGRRSPAKAWIEFLRSGIELLMTSTDLADEARASALPLTMIGDVLREKTAGGLPTFGGPYKSLSVLFQYVLAGTNFCVVKGEGPVRGVAFRGEIPSGLEQLLDEEREPRILQIAEIGMEGKLGLVPRPSESDPPDDWAAYLRTIVSMMLDGGEFASLQSVGARLAELSYKPLEISGLTKLTPFLQFALTGSEYCVVERSMGEFVVTRRDASVAGRRMPDIELRGGSAQIIEPGPGYQTVQQYRKLLRESIPPLNFTDAGLEEVLDKLLASPPDHSSFEELSARISAELPDEIARRTSANLGLLVAVDILHRDGNDGMIALGSDQGLQEIRRRLEERATQIIQERLGEANAAIIGELVGL